MPRFAKNLATLVLHGANSYQLQTCESLNFRTIPEICYGSIFAHDLHVERTLSLGWVLVIAVGMSAALTRIAGPSLLADFVAITYLLTATLVFERERRTALVRAHAPVHTSVSHQN